MKKKVLAVILCLALAVSVSACKKKETKPPVPQTPGSTAPGPMMPMSPEQMPQRQMPPGPIMQSPISPEGQRPVPGRSMSMTKGKTKVVVPETVKGKWRAVKIVFEDKIAKQTQEYTVNLNSDFIIPNSNLKIHVGEFLPDFKMEGLTLTSRSNEPNNPAVGIKVFEGDKQIFPAPGKQWGWLWSHKELQAIHPFNHPRYSLTLKEGVSKKG